MAVKLCLLLHNGVDANADRKPMTFGKGLLKLIRHGNAPYAHPASAKARTAFEKRSVPRGCKFYRLAGVLAWTLKCGLLIED